MYKSGCTYTACIRDYSLMLLQNRIETGTMVGWLCACSVLGLYTVVKVPLKTKISPGVNYAQLG